MRAMHLVPETTSDRLAVDMDMDAEPAVMRDLVELRARLAVMQAYIQAANARVESGLDPARLEDYLLRVERHVTAMQEIVVQLVEGVANPHAHAHSDESSFSTHSY